MQFNTSGKPIFLQIAEHIMLQITAKKYNDGDRLPSVREYATQAEVNANTMMRTYDYLERNGVIYNKRGIGFFVAPEAATTIRKLLSEQFFSSELPPVFNTLRTLGVTAEQLASLYENYLNSNS